jgi:Ca2+-transporting ATPase
LRLKIYNNNDLTVSGEELDHMNAAELDNAISKATIFYRVNPKHKLTIVKVNFRKRNWNFFEYIYLFRPYKHKDILLV